jgi:hypothetical protein
MAANLCVRLRHGQAVISCLTPIRAQDNRHPWLKSSACGIVPQVLDPDAAFEFQQYKQPAAISTHDAFICSHAHPFTSEEVLLQYE